MIAVIDYAAGNIRSVCNALGALETEFVLTSNPMDLVDADGVILPGVGAFGHCMATLRESGMVEALNEVVFEGGTPYLGICLGMQFLATVGLEHGEHEGLGWIDGTCAMIEPNDSAYRVPHIGWNDLDIVQETPLFEAIEDELVYYFVHSYHFVPSEDSLKYVSATCQHGGVVAASVQKDNIFGVQFHPEKSQRAGLSLLSNFLKLTKGKE